MLGGEQAADRRKTATDTAPPGRVSTLRRVIAPIIEATDSAADIALARSDPAAARRSRPDREGDD
jgi:hypothetical protein